MKFGKRLLREQSSDWREHYICYKARRAAQGVDAQADYSVPALRARSGAQERHLGVRQLAGGGPGAVQAAAAGGAGQSERVLHGSVVRRPSSEGAAQRAVRRTPRPLTRRPGRSNALSAELDALERAVRPPGSAAQPGGAPTHAALAAAQRALVSTVVPLLGRLRLFVVLNYTAVVKVRRPRPAQHTTGRVMLRLAARCSRC